jgi:hypothetical protein
MLRQAQHDSCCHPEPAEGRQAHQNKRCHPELAEGLPKGDKLTKTNVVTLSLPKGCRRAAEGLSKGDTLSMTTDSQTALLLIPTF